MSGSVSGWVSGSVSISSSASGARPGFAAGVGRRGNLGITTVESPRWEAATTAASASAMPVGSPTNWLR